MKIRWARVFAGFFAVTALVLWVRHRRALSATWDAMFRLGPGQPEEDKLVGLTALALIGICVLAVVRLVSRGRDS